MLEIFGALPAQMNKDCENARHALSAAAMTEARDYRDTVFLPKTDFPMKVGLPQKELGIVRLRVLSVDYTEDHRISDEIPKGAAGQYRKLRNSFRYLLGALDGFSEAEKLPVSEMPELERYVLHLLADIDAKLKQAVDDFDFNSYFRLLSEFATNSLSAFCFDIRKDSLYCDAVNNPKRRAYRTALDILFHALVRYAARVLVFTAEEVWGTRFPEAGSAHLLEWPEVDAAWVNEQLGLKWKIARYVRGEITKVLETDRREKRIGSSLEAIVSAQVAWKKDGHDVLALDFAELTIVSKAHLSLRESRGGGMLVEVQTGVTTDHKCGRCWRHLPEVQADGALCGRCEEVVNG